jgi:hypothetical protein
MQSLSDAYRLDLEACRELVLEAQQAIEDEANEKGPDFRELSSDAVAVFEYLYHVHCDGFNPKEQSIHLRTEIWAALGRITRHLIVQNLIADWRHASAAKRRSRVGVKRRGGA